MHSLVKTLLMLTTEKIEGKFWIWAVGAADANVEVLSLVIFQGTI